MRLVNYLRDNKGTPGLIIEEGVIDLTKAAKLYKEKVNNNFYIPCDLMGWIEGYSDLYSTLREIEAFLRNKGIVGRLIEADIKPLAPIERPSKIMCLGLNYSKHAHETGFEVPKEPVIFAKLANTINNPEADVVCSRELGRVDPEAELAVIISKKAKNIKKEDAFNYVLGYTVLNDFTARDMQARDINAKNPWYRSKNIDGFCPVGPYIVFKEDVDNPHELDIRLEVNGEVRQNDSTKNLIFKIPDMIEYITSMVTLNPGDIIATGTPSGIQEVVDGDVMEVIIEKVGTLKNTVKVF